MFWSAVRPLLADDTDALVRLDQIREGFAAAMDQALEPMWTRKLGLQRYDDTLVNERLQLMLKAQVDYTILFRRLFVPRFRRIRRP